MHKAAIGRYRGKVESSMAPTKEYWTTRGVTIPSY